MQKRKSFTGVITSNKMEKTVVVTVERTVPHKKYGKVIQLKKKYYAHTDSKDHNIGDVVNITETRPLSKTKRWRVVQ